MSILHLEDPGPDPRDSNEPRLRTRRGDHEDDATVLEIIQSTWQHEEKQWHPYRWLRRTFVSLLTLGVVVAAVLLGAAAWLRHAMRAALPQVDGTLHVAGLSAPVTVTRNAQGVPSIRAANLDDLVFAQGFVTAQDRLWQMDALRRHEAGELAEVLGKRLIEHDRTQRILQTRAAAEHATKALPADQLHQLQAYANGVNAFIAQNEDHLPVEFKLLHYKPAPWTPADSMLAGLAMFQDLSTQFPGKMKREALMAHLRPDLAADLYPVGSWRDRPPMQPRPDLTTPVPFVEEIPLDDTQVKLHRPQVRPETATPKDVLRLAAAMPGANCAECRSGSNNWAVSGRRSASGAPLVSNDMHLSLSVPDIWYEAGLHAPVSAENAAFDVVGFTLPGTPFVLVGRNAHVAWGFTNLGADVQDVRVEHVRGDGNSAEYQKEDGTWAPVQHTTERIRVRGGKDVDVDVQTTNAVIGGTEIATPVISPLFPSEKRTLSLAWTAYDPANLTLPLFAADSANDGASLVVAFANFGGPVLNLVYADRDHIGYHALGRVPVRGSMERQERIPATILPEPTGPKPKDEDESEDPADAPQASLHTSRGFLHDAAFHPPARKRLKAKPQEPTHRAKRERREVPTEAARPPAQVLPAPAVTNYTVGSPIASVPVDSADKSHQWVGYVPYNELPSTVDPLNGVIATANSRITSDSYGYFISNDWMPPYRAARIYKLLEGREKLTPADMLAVQNDVHSDLDIVIAQKLAYAVDHASPQVLRGDEKRLRQAADMLRQWKGEVTPDTPAPALVMAFRSAVWPMLLLPQIAAHDGDSAPKLNAEEVAKLYQWGGQAVALELMLQYRPARWLPAQYKSWDDMLTAALARGLHDDHAPSDLAKWRYSALYKVEISHPVFSLIPVMRRVLGVPTGTGPRETGGDSNTIRAMAGNHGPSERFTADLADGEAMTGNITTGECGNPASPWYLDQFEPWLRGTTFALPLHGADGAHILALLP